MEKELKNTFYTETTLTLSKTNKVVEDEDEKLISLLLSTST